MSAEAGAIMSGDEIDTEQAIGNLGDLPSIPPPSGGLGGRFTSTGTATSARSASVYFHPDDTNQETPALPIKRLKEELMKRHGEEKYNKEYKECLDRADNNFDGLITVDELVMVIERLHEMKSQNLGLKRALGMGAAALLLVLLAIFGLTFAVVKLTKEVTTGTDENPNALVSSHTNMIVDTHPSDGGGIYLDMVAFTQPVNMTFPGFDGEEALECVGQISTTSIDQNYDKFTTGGSAMTIRYVDYSRDKSPVVYTYIPGSNVEVTGANSNLDTSEQAAGAEAITQAIIEAQASGRRLEEVTAEMMQQSSNPLHRSLFDEFGVLYDQNSIQCMNCFDDCPSDMLSPFCGGDDSGNTRINSGKNDSDDDSDSDDDDEDDEDEEKKKDEDEDAEEDEDEDEDAGDDEDEDEDGDNRRKRRRRRQRRNRRRKLQAAGKFQYKKIAGYMKSFSTQENNIVFTKDVQISDQYYFVCLAP